ncbi:MAG: methylated-DNA--[protein]-cysteine S-methyltransferase [Gemmatimonadetes bacterium]|nr:methylated-DNA--[protein]-cysteine S-methyltransferase [Gemmatimonadota bacterium]
MPGGALGTLSLWVTSRGLRRLDFRSGPDLAHAGERLSDGSPPDHLRRAVEQLGEYLAGNRRAFDLPLDPGQVTPFQGLVYERLRAIPHGQVVTYGEVARDIGADAVGAARAVGQAVGANPLAIVIPCHRVVASDRRLHGYGGGLARKAALLRLEGLEVEGEEPASRVRPEVLRLL